VSPAKRLACLLLALAPLSVQAAARISDPRMPEGEPRRISEHTWELESFPDVAFVVGTKATLVVDTGLGPANGAIVARQAQRLASRMGAGGKLYLVTTHFHPEHAAGEGGFPAGTVLVRSRAQQAELEHDGDAIMGVFRSRPQFAGFLPPGITFRPPDQLFDAETTLDLGGVHARIVLVGPAHTIGDQVVWVDEDRTLMTGDLAMFEDPPRRFATGANAAVWISALDRLAAFSPLHVVPDHGPPGGPELISNERAVLAAQLAGAKAP
jgi:glyoxylase-like metal-dependent hydrolase (beta-lactamase superfamily II)